MTNMNEKTGIRYGVLSHGIGPLYELFMYYGTNVSYEAGSKEWDEPEYTYERDGFKALLTYLGGAPVVYVLESPYVAWCRQCSPCCPNAGNLDEMCGGVLAYCFDPEDHEEAASFVTSPFRDGLTLVSRKED